MQPEDDDAMHEDEVKHPGPSSALEVGLQLDVLDSVQKWSEAEVVEVDSVTQRVHVSYIYWDDYWNEWIDMSSHRLAPFGSQTYQPGGTLRLNQRVEALDEMQKWIEAEIIDIDEYRVKIHYRNWHAKYDEWIHKGSPRIRPYGRQKRPAKRPAMQPSLVRTQSQVRTRTLTSTSQEYDRYLAALRAQGLRVQTIEGDGNCMFRSVSHQVYGDERHHKLVRRVCMEYMESEKSYFEPYVVGDMSDFIAYLNHKRQDAVWGDDPELQALCELYDRPCEIWSYDQRTGAKKLRTFHESSSGRDRLPMRLSYYGGGHYDSIVNASHAGSVLRTPPGELEESRIQLSRTRVASGFEETKHFSDMAATEQAEIDHALQESRLEFDRQATDLEFIFSEQLEFVRAQADLECTDDELAATVAAQSAQEHDEQERQRVMRQAEEDELRRALAASENIEHIGDPELEQALLLSTADASAETDELQQALALSVHDGTQDLESVLAMSAAEAGGGDDLQAALAMSAAEADEDMQKALQLSRTIS